MKKNEKMKNTTNTMKHEKYDEKFDDTYGERKMKKMNTKYRNSKRYYTSKY